MIHRLLTTGCFLLLAMAFASASAFQNGNREFRAGEFAAAAASYEKQLASTGPDAAVFYNLGNSYQSLKQYGPAILAYERARLLTPRDPDLLANLALARKAAAAFEDAGDLPKWRAVVHYLSPAEWSWLAVGSGLFLGGVSVLAGAVKLPRRARSIAGASAVVAVIALGVAGSALYLRRGESARGIVLTDTATVRLSPFETAEALGTPGPGRAVQLGARTGGFHYVVVPGTNLRGWMAAADVAAIIPRDAGK